MVWIVLGGGPQGKSEKPGGRSAVQCVCEWEAAAAADRGERQGREGTQEAQALQPRPADSGMYSVYKNTPLDWCAEKVQSNHF